MSVRRLVSVFEAQAVTRVTSNTINLTSPVVDVQSLIQKFEAWVPLAVPVAEIRPSTCPHFQAPTKYVTQPAAALAVAPVVESKSETAQVPSVEIFEASELHKNSPLTARTAETEAETPQVSSVEIFNTFELHKNPPSVAPVAKAKPEAPQVPSVQIVNVPAQHQNSPIRALAVSTATTATVTLLPTRTPVPQQFQPRPSVRQGVTSRLFSYETDPKYLKRRAEAKLRRVAAAAKSSLPTWAH
ncbi:hypothetical protein V7S43_006311 [Phytophthora oleae]|uniref:Uncharacterized protein n=1 Tax=Phytophthora oleae TaxID=2107226 RepID=A0ABD3FTH4_9STRA